MWLPISCDEKGNGLLTEFIGRTIITIAYCREDSELPATMQRWGGGAESTGSAEKGRSYVADEEIRLIFFIGGAGDPKIWHVAGL